MFLTVAGSAMGTLPFSVRSSAEVSGGPYRVIGDALVYPSPFNRARDKELIIQYRLSHDTDIDIFIISVSGDILKKISLAAGHPGGSAGLNKVKWSSRADDGTLPGNGIYVGTIVDRLNNQVMKKFKLTINDQ
ncbi:hypothetical protein A3K48_01860 [candidate division WOR-1 bacterium RIFOXYA12_FULL_52_29]|uniref:FlgD Ig-like domain-containing protein n=1 Tax=candidate division WOR-1 bacterium RIFOXYC12_FULL_54_18 TaxID=1802584 RepID=A0A1F4T4L5_UNCSA|nr:MAG: hypothetical protein A3K44_01860 [candidate division WOR-1 bacterium RIFOXYA2_FULL_51_19]OGC17328.1 MAG: hypothetical protein A3K48_01860 [candidate division WOR-1 bacterium RIFOXYA12_FULL_52_29]OGC26188.1 MAG: hypothetical protein A3K32_01855 [candidate division WOR-1 bacterium RIFOXYB2_FULL_45_9]OGC27745.1 MAG: hypothetical protein A3K49_01860 [candidate division WOR-1 bacterium RIFOXYC12_FULL_54_18]OGC29964.1 MAG: hypothetical protein A2346_04475 [candidate division WOR-1 bacterium R